MKRELEAKIKELEDQINLLKNQSGDLVTQLQAKIKELMETHERDKKTMVASHEAQIQ